MVKLENNYYIDADDKCFMLKKKTVTENGKEFFEVKGYLKTVEQALKYYAITEMRNKVSKGEVRSINGLKKAIETLTKQIEEKAKELYKRR